MGSDHNSRIAHGVKPIVALDIDGTLGDYHGHFARFAQAWTGRELPDLSNFDGRPFHKFLGMSKATYRQCKLAYRQGGMKRSMPVYEGASNLTKHIRNSGAEVWICTTRPYLRLDNIDPDTRHWLRRNHIQYDGILYGQRKYRDLVRIVGQSRVLFVVDDLPEMVEAAWGLDIGAVLRLQSYNIWWMEEHVKVPVASTMLAIQEIFDESMERWLQATGSKGT